MYLYYTALHSRPDVFLNHNEILGAKTVDYPQINNA